MNKKRNKGIENYVWFLFGNKNTWDIIFSMNTHAPEDVTVSDNNNFIAS